MSICKKGAYRYFYNFAFVIVFRLVAHFNTWKQEIWIYFKNEKWEKVSVEEAADGSFEWRC